MEKWWKKRGTDINFFLLKKRPREYKIEKERKIEEICYNFEREEIVVLCFFFFPSHYKVTMGKELGFLLLSVHQSEQSKEK